MAAYFNAIDMHLANGDSQAELLELGKDGVLQVCTFVQGSGDIPENLQPLYADLDQRPRYLGALHYGVIAQGDRLYGDAFAAGGKQFGARLQDLGAQRVGEVFTLDASENTRP